MFCFTKSLNKSNSMTAEIRKKKIVQNFTIINKLFYLFFIKILLKIRCNKKVLLVVYINFI